MSPVERSMLISPDTDAETVCAIEHTIVAAVDSLNEGAGCKLRARDLLEGMLCTICCIIQDAPNDEVKAALADRAMSFIVRNSGMPAAALLSARLARRHAAAIRDRANPLATIKPEGSA